MVEETKNFFVTIGLEINKDKYSTRTPICQEDTKLLNGYKYQGIIESKNHQKLFNAKTNTHVSISGSSIWLKHGNIKADKEGRLCGLQDRNLFCGNIPICNHCKEARGIINHVATRCNRILSHDYT